MTRPGSVAVIGAGIVGLSAALALQRRGWQITILDPGEPRGRASFGNAGVISRGSILPVAAPGLVRQLPRYLLRRDPAVRVRLATLPAFVPWVVRFLRRCTADAWQETARAMNPLVAAGLEQHLLLARELGTEHLIQQTGYLRVYRNPRALEAARLEREILAAHGVAVEALTADDIAGLEPHLARRYACGLIATESASVRTPGTLVERLTQAFFDRGGSWRRETVRQIAAGPERVTLRSNAGILQAARVVLAAGARSGTLARQLGDPIPLVAERGYHREVALSDDATLARPVHDADGGFVMAPMDGRVRVTSGVELARPDDPPDHGQIRAVFADAARSLPFAEDTAGEVWMGSRPSTPDGLPVIGHAGRSRDVLYAFGHGHIGFSTGPATGAIVADLFEGRTPTIPTAPFSPRRFSGA